MLVRVVLPHRADVRLEQHVVTAHLDLGRAADVIEQAPEVLHRREAGHLIHRIGPLFRAVHLEVPQRPGVLERMLDQTLRIDRLRCVRLLGQLLALFRSFIFILLLLLLLRANEKAEHSPD